MSTLADQTPAHLVCLQAASCRYFESDLAFCVPAARGASAHPGSQKGATNTHAVLWLLLQSMPVFVLQPSVTVSLTQTSAWLQVLFHRCLHRQSYDGPPAHPDLRLPRRGHLLHRQRCSLPPTDNTWRQRHLPVSLLLLQLPGGALCQALRCVMRNSISIIDLGCSITHCLLLCSGP